MTKKSTLFILLLITGVFWLVIACKNKTIQPSMNQSSAKDTVLVVLMDFQETEILNEITSKITEFYHIPVKVIKSKLPTSSFIPSNGRFQADTIIRHLKLIGGGKYRFVAGLTSKDICCTKDKNPYWGIFGLGSLSNDGCISSTKRLKKGVSKEKLTERIQKVVLHEIGHNHHINHCTSPYPCFMKAAEGKLSTVDAEPMDVCVVCRKMIH